MMTASTRTTIRMITQTGSPPSSSTGVTGPGGSDVGAGTAVAGRSAGASAMVGAGGFVGAASAIVGLAVDAANGTTVGAPVRATGETAVGARAGRAVGASVGENSWGDYCRRQRGNGCRNRGWRRFGFNRWSY